MEKPDCYKCVYRGGVPGDAHSCCNHPSVKKSPLGELMGILGPARGLALPMEPQKLKIKANAHGVRSGWFAWPYNFDPVWLEECDGFKKKKEAT